MRGVATVLGQSPVVDGVVDSPAVSLGSVRDAAEVFVFRPILPSYTKTTIVLLPEGKTTKHAHLYSVIE